MNINKKLNWQVYSVGFMILGVVVLYFSSGNSASIGVSDGVKLCLNVVVPSLFPFMVISSFIVESGIVDIISKPISLFSRKVLKLNPSAGGVFVMSMIGGYPTGARMISSLVNQNKLSKNDAKRMIPFCISAGPGFIITAVGTNIFGSSKIGLTLFFSQTIATIILAIGSGLVFGKKDVPTKNSSKKTKLNSVPNSFVSSVISSANALFNISAFVIIFSCISSMLSYSGILDLISRFLSTIFHFTELDESFFTTLINGILEIVQGCISSAKIRGSVGYYVCSFFLSFSSFSIIFQVLSCTQNINPKLSNIILYRLIHSIIAIFTLTMFVKFSPDTSYVLSSFDPMTTTTVLSGSPEASAMLFFLCSFLLFSLGNTPKKS